MCLLTQTRGISKVSQFAAKAASLEDTQEGLKTPTANRVGSRLVWEMIGHQNQHG